jgi:hypothetical protein
MAAINWAKQKGRSSENIEDEFLSVAVVKNNRTVVCGTQDGVLAFFKLQNSVGSIEK